MVGAPLASADRGLMELGLDSFDIEQLAQRLTSRHPLAALAPSDLFSAPTVRALVLLVHRRSTGSGPEPAASALAPCLAERVAWFSGFSANLPPNTGLKGAREMAASGADAVSEVPAERWSLSGDGTAVAGRMRHGALLGDIDLFDDAFFGVSPAEAAAMDPQQRLLLEGGYAALHGAGLSRRELLGSVTGVFLGTSYHDFERLLYRKVPSSAYAATGGSLAIASGRLSYILGMQGPAVSYDTACSAALTASHAATSALRLGECESGLVAGVSLMLLPDVSHSFAVAGMLSALGRSHDLHGCPRPTVSAGRTVIAANPVVSSISYRIFFVGTGTPKNYFVFE